MVPGWVQEWGTISDIVVAATAVFGVLFGLAQLGRIARANISQENIARAELMLEIDAMFEGPDMTQSRLAIRTLRNYCEKQARAFLRSGANDQEVLERSATLFSEEVTALFQRFNTADHAASEGEAVNEPLDKDGPRYFTLIRLPYWIETVGQLCRRELLPLDDVLDLYDAAIVGIMKCFHQHIMDRRAAPPQRNERFLEQALWLMEQAELRQVAEADRLAHMRSPIRSGLFQTPSLFRIRRTPKR